MAFLFALIRQIPAQRRFVLVLFILLSAIGEAIFSLGFGLYDYRLGGLPFYVPLVVTLLIITYWADFVLAVPRFLGKAN